MALTPVRVTGKYLSTDGRSTVDPTKLVALPPVLLPGEQYVYPVAAKLRGDGEFLLPLFADSATSLTYALTETLGGSTRTVSVTVPAGASGELKLADLAGYSQPTVATLDGAGDLSLATLRAAFGARPMTVDDWTYPMTWFHRGGSNVYPENTMEAFRGALAAGAQCIETDVRLLADGTLAVMHDATVDRTTSSAGNISDHTAASVPRLVVDASSYFGGGWPDLRVPMLPEVIRETARQTVLSVEAKMPDSMPGLIAAVQRTRAPRSFILGSFNLNTAGDAAAAGIPAAYFMITGAEATPAQVVAKGIMVVGIEVISAGFTSAWVDSMHAVGLKVAVYTVQRQSEVVAALAKGADIFISNDPVYSHGPIDGYKYRRTSMPFRAQTYYHGHIPGASTSNRGVFTAPDGFGWNDTTNAGARTELAGAISPLKGDPNTNTATLDFTAYIESQADANRFFGMFVGQDNDAGFADNGTGAGVDGYRPLINGGGNLQIAKYTNGVQQPGSISAASAPLVYPATVTGKVIMSPTQITIQRTDVAATLTMTDAEHRGGYVHMEMSGTTGHFTRLEVTA